MFTFQKPNASIHNSKFNLFHYTQFMITQPHVYFNALNDYSLEISEENNKPTSKRDSSSFFLENNKPIKTVEYNGHYWIADGYHTLFRGLLSNYDYFLTEVNMMYCPAWKKGPTKYLDLYMDRYNENKSYKRVEKINFCTQPNPVKDCDKLLDKFINLCETKLDIHVFNYFEEIVSSKL
jgi:hypothetical protein